MLTAPPHAAADCASPRRACADLPAAALRSRGRRNPAALGESHIPPGDIRHVRPASIVTEDPSRHTVSALSALGKGSVDTSGTNQANTAHSSVKSRVTGGWSIPGE
ncbi:unnamed protein product [Rangifer tarandus platyrhynchus]|uniref:Uncharacterized protein n=1 Tax=Rangifer tarandus platyrhynchus TaxID=3082113 RepID=A0AC59Z1C4_RANTA